MPARGTVIKSLRPHSVSGPNFIVIRQTAHPLGQQRVGHYILGKAQYQIGKLTFNFNFHKIKQAISKFQINLKIVCGLWFMVYSGVPP